MSDPDIERERVGGVVEPTAEPAPTAPRRHPRDRALGLDDPARLRAAVEAVLFVVESPVSAAQLATALQRPEPDVDRGARRLAAAYDERGAGVEVREIAGGWRIYTRPELGTGRRGVPAGGPAQPAVPGRPRDAGRHRLPAAGHPGADLGHPRGQRRRRRPHAASAAGLITEVGSDPETGGGLYRTTDLFLEKMGLQSLAELPSLGPFVARAGYAGNR